jgi:hypothetical protein
MNGANVDRPVAALTVRGTRWRRSAGRGTTYLACPGDRSRTRLDERNRGGLGAF